MGYGRARLTDIPIMLPKLYVVHVAGLWRELAGTPRWQCLTRGKEVAWFWIATCKNKSGYAPTKSYALEPRHIMCSARRVFYDALK